MSWMEDAIHAIDMLSQNINVPKHNNVAIQLRPEELPELMATVSQPVDKLFGVRLDPGHRCMEHAHDQPVEVVMLHDHPTPLRIKSQRIPTIAGGRVFVPAGLKHSVDENQTEETRYTIAIMYRNHGESTSGSAV